MHPFIIFIIISYALPLISMENQISNDSESREPRSAFVKSLWEEQMSPWHMDKPTIRDMFDRYHECLTKEADMEMNDTIVAILAIEGQRVSMTCNFCMKPGDHFEDAGAWLHLRQADTTMEYMTNSGRTKIDDEKTLIIKQVDVKDIGQFHCVGYAVVRKVYQVDVVLGDRRRKVDKDNKPAPEVKMKDRNLMIATRWSKWSKCSSCGRPGKRRRFGLCMVQKIDKNKPVKPWGFPLIDLFKDGMPCQSKVLPKYISRIPEISERSDEIMTEDCLIKCPKKTVTIIRNSNGRVIETILPGYEQLNKKPDIPKMTIRKLIYAVFKSPLKLNCPRTTPRDNVNWKRKKKIISPVALKERSRGRVYIDTIHRLNFKSIRRQDTAAYSCYNGDKLVAVFKVVVTKAESKRTKNYISFIGFILTCICVTIIVICVCIRRKSKTLR